MVPARAEFLAEQWAGESASSETLRLVRLWVIVFVSVSPQPLPGTTSFAKMPKKHSLERSRPDLSGGTTRLSAMAIPGLPEIRKGHDVAKQIVSAVHRAGIPLRDGDVVVVAQKIVSKAEGRVARLAEVKPSERARELAKGLSRDARFIEVVLQESRRIVRGERALIVETRHGFVCANAGVDHSNTGQRGCVTLLPKDPDRSARRLASSLRKLTGKRVAVIISDTFGRPWRLGLVNFAIGAAGVPALVDLRGTRDRNGRLLTATVLAVADELAAAAGLLMGKKSGTPVIVIRGYGTAKVGAGGKGEGKAGRGSGGAKRSGGASEEGAARLIRAAEEDLFR